MATFIEAYRDFGPRLELNTTATLEDIAELMSMRIGLNAPQVLQALREIGEVIVYLNRQGTPVNLPGVGIFRPSIARDGELRINFRTAPLLRDRINSPNAYRGPIVNREHIGVDDATLKALWDAEHPDDPLTL